MPTVVIILFTSWYNAVLFLAQCFGHWPCIISLNMYYSTSCINSNYLLVNWHQLSGAVEMLAQCLRNWANVVRILCKYRLKFPTNTIHWTNGRVMLILRLQRWPNTTSRLVQCLVFTGTLRCEEKSVVSVISKIERQHCWNHVFLFNDY